MSQINLQCSERAELYGVSLRFICQRADGSIDLLVQRAADLDAPDRELMADNQFLRESLQTYEAGGIPTSEREESLERKCESLCHEVARLTAKLQKHRVEQITGDPYQAAEAWEGPRENCPKCQGRYTGGKLCEACREGVTA